MPTLKQMIMNQTSVKKKKNNVITIQYCYSLTFIFTYPHICGSPVVELSFTWTQLISRTDTRAVSIKHFCCWYRVNDNFLVHNLNLFPLPEIKTIVKSKQFVVSQRYSCWKVLYLSFFSLVSYIYIAFRHTHNLCDNYFMNTWQ